VTFPFSFLLSDLLTMVYQTAAVLFEALKAITVSHKIQVDQPVGKLLYLVASVNCSLLFLFSHVLLLLYFLTIATKTTSI
jgi:hypothetical protein